MQFERDEISMTEISSTDKSYLNGRWCVFKFRYPASRFTFEITRGSGD